ncbi:MAG TPA: serine hydrolase domain-containing protein, partial [Planctomycetaceae bacterium]|nr:serine hydrolase domain-containing protein [Planctomycetaceae bacterium]
MRRLMLAAMTAALCVMSSADPAVAQPTWSAAADRVFAPWSVKDSPGCAVGVFQQGRIVFEKGYGMADLEHDVPITPDAVFYAGSVSKQFTAMAAALAIQQGKLSAGDPIRKYLPELPAYADPITVRHLVHHTSGLRDYNTLLSIAGRRGDEAYDNPTVLRMTARQTALNFAPGSEYLYSNTGYTLLATIVERAAGVPFATFADTHIFKPLGMTSTFFGVDASRLVPKRAYAYSRGSNGEIRLDTPSNQRAGAGGVYTTVRDLLKWDQSFYDGRLGGRELVRRVETPGTLADGSALTYAWGLQIGRYRGLRVVEHGGSLGGYRAHLMRLPEAHTSVAALCNTGSIAPSGLVRQVADAVLGGRFSEPAPQRAAGAPPGGGRGAGGRGTGPQTPVPGDPARYTGRYHSDEIDATF